MTSGLRRYIAKYAVANSWRYPIRRRVIFDSELGDNCIQNVHLGRYIVGYMVGNFVLRRRVSGAVKRNFRPYNRWYTSQKEHFEYGYPHSNALFNIYSSKAQYFAPNWSFVSNVKTTTTTNHKRRHLGRRCSDGISQNMQTQILDVIQSDVALHSQVH